MRWYLTGAVALLVALGLSGCGDGRGGPPASSATPDTRPQPARRAQQSAEDHGTSSPNDTTRVLGTDPARSCGVLSLEEVRTVARGAVKTSDNGAVCAYGRSSPGGSEYNQLLIQLFSSPAAKRPADVARKICQGTVTQIHDEGVDKPQLLSKQHPLPGFGPVSQAFAWVEGPNQEQTTGYSATWLQGDACVNVLFTAREPRPASFADFTGLMESLASHL